MLSTSNPGRLWWYSDKTRNDGIHDHSLRLERVYLSKGIFTGCSICFGEWTNSGRTNPDKQSFSHLCIRMGTTQWRETSWRLHHPSESTLQNFLEKQSRCSFLEKITQSSRSRIAILANEVICNHHPWHCARRLPPQSDFFSKRRSMSIMSASRVWGYVYLYVWKIIRPDKNVMNRIKQAFEALKAPCYRTSPIITRGSKCGPNPWQQYHRKARDALQSATKGERKFTSIWDRWQNDGAYRTSQLARDWSDAWVR